MDYKLLAIQVLWSFMEQFLRKASLTIITITLALILTPADFGRIALALTVATIGNCIIDGGLKQSLIKQDINEKNLNASFIINIILGVSIFTTQYMAAPIIADIYNDKELAGIIQTTAWGAIIYAFQPVSSSILTKKMQFGKLMKISFPSVILSGSTAIVMAHNGYGINALTTQYLVGLTSSSILLTIASDWKPKLRFDKKSIVKMLSCSRGFFITNILEVSFQNIYILTISKVSGAHLTGCFFFANKIKEAILGQLITSIQTVYFSASSLFKDDKNKLKLDTHEILVVTNFCSTPILILSIYLCAPFFVYALSSSWSPAGEYLKIILFGSILFPAHIANLNLLKLLGTARQLIITDAIKKTFASLALIITYKLGVTFILWGYASVSILAFFINAMHSKELINYSIKDQILDLLPPYLICAISMIILFIMMHNTTIYSISYFVVSTTIFTVSYIGLSHLLNKNQTHIFLNFIKKIKGRK